MFISLKKHNLYHLLIGILFILKEYTISKLYKTIYEKLSGHLKFQNGLQNQTVNCKKVIHIRA